MVFKDPSGCYVKNKMGSVKTRVETERSVWGTPEKSKKRMRCLDKGGSHGDREKCLDLGCILERELIRRTDRLDSDGRKRGRIKDNCQDFFALVSDILFLHYLLTHRFIQQVVIECLLYTSTESCAILNPSK